MDFLDIIDPICSCRTNVIETTAMLQSLFPDLRKLNISFIPFNVLSLCRIHLFGNPAFTDEINSESINTIIKFINSTNLFSGSLFL